MKTSFLLPFLLTPVCAFEASAALSLSALNTPVDASFTGFTAPAIWASTTAGPGQLDSNRWAMNADGSLTDTPATFGADQSGGQGSSTGGESATGVYAFDVGGGTTALGVQPTGTFWSPGMFTLRLRNETGGTLTSLQVEWTGWVYNDQGRSNDLRFYHSEDNLSYTPAGTEFNVVSPDLPDTAPVAWTGSPRSFEISGLSLVDGGTYYLRWGGDDVGGSGSRDELALGGVRVTPVPEPATLGLLALGTLVLLPRRR